MMENEARPSFDPNGQTTGNGELAPPEFFYRIGLLLGCGIFFNESFGLPWSRNLFGLLGMMVAVLMTLTLVFRWTTLGDWRRTGNRVLYVLLAMVLAFPVAAALDPQIGSSMLPEYLEGALTELAAVMARVPGTTTILAMLKGAVSFFLLAVTLGVLVLGSGGGRRGGLIVAATILSLICLFFYPTIETMIGFFFLGMFLSSQWEIPVMVPDKVRPHLSDLQMEFLGELVREGALSTGETRVYLDNTPRNFTELMDFKLVDYDPISREVVPGSRLVGHGATDAVEKGFSIFRRVMWIGVGVVYFLLPDLIPGPLDDIVIMAICTLSGLDIFSLIRGAGPVRRLR